MDVKQPNTWRNAKVLKNRLSKGLILSAPILNCNIIRCSQVLEKLLKFSGVMSWRAQPLVNLVILTFTTR